MRTARFFHMNTLSADKEPSRGVSFGLLGILIFAALTSINLFAQAIPQNQYGLRVVDTEELYAALVRADSSNLLVDLEEYLPGVTLDIRYATADNFAGTVLYPAAKAFARLPVAEALKKTREELLQAGADIKIYDAYRPYAITCKIWEFVRDDNFAASPKTGSRHNRGCAIDVTLIDALTKQELAMPTPYDDFSPKAASDFADLADSIITHRNLLQSALTRNGFQLLKSEWWHFDFTDWRKYPIMDIPFDILSEKPGTIR